MASDSTTNQLAASLCGDDAFSLIYYYYSFDKGNMKKTKDSGRKKVTNK